MCDCLVSKFQKKSLTKNDIRRIDESIVELKGALQRPLCAVAKHPHEVYFFAGRCVCVAKD